MPVALVKRSAHVIAATNMRTTWKIIAIASSGMLIVSYFLVFPYGPRPCTVSCVMNGLMVYAEMHDGRFPADLSELSPNYVSPEALAGLSGSRSKARKAVNAHTPIGDYTSWIYVKGLKRGENRVIVFDKTTITDGGGKRMFSKGRWVGFANGTIRRVPASEWGSFAKDYGLSLTEQQ